ncbi:MAG: terminase, partial [bacterium]
HMNQNLRPALNEERFVGKAVSFIGDPSGVSKNSITELDMFAYIESQGYRAYPAPTNDIDLRLQAVESLLMQNIGGRPVLLIDGKNCPMLVQALHSKYLFAKRKDGENRSIPEKKHPWSDLTDALQYGALAVQGGFHQAIKRDVDRRLNRQVEPRRTMVAGGWT